MQNPPKKRTRQKRNPTIDKLVKILATSEKYKFQNAANTLDTALKDRSEHMDELFTRIAVSELFTVETTVKALGVESETSDHNGDSNNEN